MQEEKLSNVMLDPSLVVAKRTIDKTFNLVGDFSDKFRFHISDTFLIFIYEDDFL